METLGTLLSLLVLPVLVLIPGQDRRVPGIELGAFGLLLLAGSVAVQRPGGRGERWAVLVDMDRARLLPLGGDEREGAGSP